MIGIECEFRRYEPVYQEQVTHLLSDLWVIITNAMKHFDWKFLKQPLYGYRQN